MPNHQKDNRVRERRSRAIPDDLVYAICERFLRLPPANRRNRSGSASGNGKWKKPQTWNAVNLAEWLTKQGYPTKREAIFPLIRTAIQRKFLRLHPPRAYTAKTRLGEKFPNMPADTKILDVKPPYVSDNLASTTASMLVRLIRELGPVKERKHRKDGNESVRVHIGFGSGAMTLKVAEKLALRMETEADLPPMTFHALSSGFANDYPLSAPVAFFSAFSKLNQPIAYVGLFAPPFVKIDDYDKITKFLAIRESFEEAKKIDIVVTSLAQADDDHGQLNQFLRMNTGGRASALVPRGHIGDVQWQPFSKTKPLTDVNTGIRAVTLFDLPDLVKLVNTDDKHVVLVAGPCSDCHQTKARALRPLLTMKSLRVCNHLVTDVATARELLEERPRARAGRAIERHVD
jgi:hypothetical protein